jgi:hypothetical protein
MYGFYRSRYDYIFGQYLGTVHHELPLMHFCQSVLRYQEVVLMIDLYSATPLPLMI